MLILNKLINIQASEKDKVIQDYNLHIYKNIWHYSFNDNFRRNNFQLEKNSNGQVILFSKAYHIFAPTLIYTNHNKEVLLKKNNALSCEFNPTNKNYRHVFWFLKTTNFNDFLTRRSKTSSRPQKNFPSLQTYDKYKKEINGHTEIKEFNKEFFTKNYNNLKHPEFLSGELVLDNFVKNNPDIDFKWLYTTALFHNDSVVTIGIIVDDGRSINLETIASKRDPISYGVILCADIVKYCCGKNYGSFDAGVTGIYGNYKQRIFLDSWEIFVEPEKFSRYFRVWERSFWRKVKKKLVGNGKSK